MCSAFLSGRCGEKDEGARRVRDADESWEVLVEVEVQRQLLLKTLVEQRRRLHLRAVAMVGAVGWL